MSKQIDWLYHRKSCITCKRAEASRDAIGVPVKETVNATKTRFDADEALALLDGVDTLIAMKGQKVETFDLKNDRPDDATLLARLMGPTGNLRAPTARIGRTLVVGFNEEVYARVFGG